MDEDKITPIVTFVLLMLSEVLPFITNVNGNGVMHTIVSVIVKIVKTSRKELADEALRDIQPPVVVPT